MILKKMTAVWLRINNVGFLVFFLAHGTLTWVLVYD